MTVNISDVLNSKDAILHSEGLKVFDLIDKAISKKEPVTLSFTGLRNCSSAFLNASIGKLYINYPSETINLYFKYNGINKKPMLKERIDQVIENAKDYKYHDKLVDEAIDELS